MGPRPHQASLTLRLCITLRYGCKYHTRATAVNCRPDARRIRVSQTHAHWVTGIAERAAVRSWCVEALRVVARRLGIIRRTWQWRWTVIWTHWTTEKVFILTTAFKILKVTYLKYINCIYIIILEFIQYLIQISFIIQLSIDI